MISFCLYPLLVFGRAGLREVQLEIPDFVKLVIGQIVVCSLEIHHLEVSVEITHELTLLLQLKGTRAPQDIKPLVKR